MQGAGCRVQGAGCRVYVEKRLDAGGLVIKAHICFISLNSKDTFHITQLQAQGPSQPCIESNKEEEGSRDQASFCWSNCHAFDQWWSNSFDQWSNSEPAALREAVALRHGRVQRDLEKCLDVGGFVCKVHRLFIPLKSRRKGLLERVSRVI